MKINLIFLIILQLLQLRCVPATRTARSSLHHVARRHVNPAEGPSGTHWNADSAAGHHPGGGKSDGRALRTRRSFPNEDISSSSLNDDRSDAGGTHSSVDENVVQRGLREEPEMRFESEPFASRSAIHYRDDATTSDHRQIPDGDLYEDPASRALQQPKQVTATWPKKSGAVWKFPVDMERLRRNEKEANVNNVARPMASWENSGMTWIKKRHASNQKEGDGKRGWDADMDWIKRSEDNETGQRPSATVTHNDKENERMQGVGMRWPGKQRCAPPAENIASNKRNWDGSTLAWVKKDEIVDKDDSHAGMVRRLRRPDWSTAGMAWIKRRGALGNGWARTSLQDGKRKWAKSGMSWI